MTLYTRLQGRGSWTDAARWSGGTLPVDGTTNVILFEEGDHEITGDYNTGLQINRLIKPRGATVRLNGETLLIDVNAGTDPMFLFDGYGDVDDFRVSGAITKIKQAGTPWLRLMGGSCSRWSSGPSTRFYVGASATLAELIARQAAGEIADNATNIDNLIVSGGGIVCARNIDTLLQLADAAQVTLHEGGTVTDGANGAVCRVMGDGCLLTMKSGGVQIDTLDYIAGRVDLTKSTGNLTINMLKEGFGAPLAERWAAGVLTVTTKDPYNPAELSV